MTEFLEESSSAGHDSFPLVGLPVLPLLKILRFLDYESLRKVKCVCARLYKLVKGSKAKMAEQTRVSLRRLRCYRTMFTFYTAVEIGWDVKSPREATYFQDKEVSLLEINDLYYVNIEESQVNRESAFGEWMSTKFHGLNINVLNISQMHFPPEVIDQLEAAFEKTKVRVHAAHLINSIYSAENVDHLMRILKLFSCEKVTVMENEQENIQFLSTPSFLNYMSTLKLFCCNVIPEELNPDGFFAINQTVMNTMPSDFYKLPPIFVTGPGLVLSMASLKKALQEWSQNRLTVRKWLVNLPPEVAKGRVFFDELNLHFESHDGRVRIENCVGQKLFVARCEQPEKNLFHVFFSTKENPGISKDNTWFGGV